MNISENTTPFVEKVLTEHYKMNISENASFLSNASSLNNTTAQWKEELKPFLDILMILILIITMLAIGCEITLKNLFSNMRHPLNLGIGILSQFCVMPASAYSLLRLTGIGGLHATGVLIISCCPSGVFSNTFTYFCDGDLALSVVMTTATSILAMGLTPLNLWLYGSYFETNDIVIPYKKMALSIVSVTSPVAIGMLLKRKLPRVAAWTSKIGSHTGLFLMIVCMIIEMVFFPNMFTGVSSPLYAITLALPCIGLTLGYGLATLLKRDKAVRRTIAIECGVQNVPLSLTIIAISFSLEMQEKIMLLPWLYALAMITGCIVLCIGNYICKKKSSEENVQVYEAVTVLTESSNKDIPTTEEKEYFIASDGKSIQLKSFTNGKQINTIHV